MKVQIILPIIERWYCVDLLLSNLKEAVKPKDCSVLSICTSGDAFYEHLKNGLDSIFGKKNVEIIRKQGSFVEHSQLRKNYYEASIPVSGEDIRLTKLRAVFSTYDIAVEAVDRTVDYFWFIEDDTLFQLDIFDRYVDYMNVLRADIVTGVSYYWHTDKNHSRNFWDLKVERNKEGFNQIELRPINCEDSGVIRLGATGLGNVLATREAVLSWKPESYVDMGSGADISFFYNAMVKGFRAFGIWDIYLPHITNHQGGDIEIRGRIDKSLLHLLGVKNV